MFFNRLAALETGDPVEINSFLYRNPNWNSSFVSISYFKQIKKCDAPSRELVHILLVVRREQPDTAHTKPVACQLSAACVRSQVQTLS
jgi:hypothetical protein